MTMRWLWVAFLVAAGAAVPSGYAAAADGEGACPRAGTLGVSRTVEIDTTENATANSEKNFSDRRSSGL